jgi:hypothetical protein
MFRAGRYVTNEANLDAFLVGESREIADPQIGVSDNIGAFEDAPAGLVASAA